MLEWLARPAAQRLTLTLLHFVWQGFAVMLALQVLMTIVRVRRAGTRYAPSLTALAAMAVCPLLTYAVSADRPSRSIVTELATADETCSVTSEPIGHWGGSWALTSVQADPAHVESAREPATVTRRSEPALWPIQVGSTALIDRCQPYLLAIWLTGVAVFGMRLNWLTFGVGTCGSACFSEFWRHVCSTTRQSGGCRVA